MGFAAVYMFAATVAAGLVAEIPAQHYVSEVSAEAQALSDARESLPPEEFIARLAALSDEGDNSASEFLGEILTFGALGLARDETRGCDYFEKIYLARADAAHNYATCFYAGRGREQDFVRARELYRVALRAGWRQSPCALGNMLVQGQGGAADIDQGMALCRHAAERGDPDAATDLAGYLLTGEYGARDPVAARLLLTDAAAKGQVNAAHLLGQIYARGDGVAADPLLAEQWFRTAHEGGRPDSARQMFTSLLRRGYRQTDEGTSIVRDQLEQALEWARIAAQIDPDPAERQRIAEVIPAIETLLENAASD